MRPVTVLGAGAFGTALAITFARGGMPVTLVARPEAADGLRAAGENARAMPGIAFPEGLSISGDPAAGATDGILVLAVPAQATDAYLAQHGPSLPRGPLVLAAKGIELNTGALLSEVAGRHRDPGDIAVLSGPGFAGELACGLPTALTIAAADAALVRALQEQLSTPVLRLYRSADIIGVQLGGALKNVIAIACGICAGAAMGESARAALMTRGYAEMLRLTRALGGHGRTLRGLSGLGDLALSAGSDKSRNFATGLAIGAGRAPDPGKTVEGLATAHATLALAARHGVEMPVTEATVAILDNRLAIAEAMAHLLARPLKEEG